jgi:SPOR domain
VAGPGVGRAEKLGQMSDDMSIPNAGYRGNRPGRYGRIATRMDPDTRRLMLFAGGLTGLLVCLIGASTLIGHRSGTVPVVTADVRPMRVKPDNPGGMRIDGAENDVFSGGVDNSNSKLAPAAEVPDPSGMRTTSASPPPPPAVATQDAAQSPIVAPPPPARPAAVATATAPAPTNTAPAKAPPAAASAPAVSAPIAASAAKPASAAGRPAMVQLAALTTEQAARDEWQRMTKHMPDLLNGRQPSFSRVERDGHTFWRLRTAGFSDVAQAKTFCEHVRAKGGGCSVADF